MHNTTRTPMNTNAIANETLSSPNIKARRNTRALNFLATEVLNPSPLFPLFFFKFSVFLFSQSKKAPRCALAT